MPYKIPYKDNPKVQAQQARWKAANIDKVRVYQASFQSRLRAEKKAFIRSYKAERGCLDCGERDVIVLELDHRDPKTKVRNSRGARNGKETDWKGLSWDEIAIELAKCDVVCANCHRRRTSKMMGWT